MASQEITVRGLSADEVSRWADFCASCFSYKPNPPPASYFERHFYNDPRRDSELIRVAFTADGGEMVSSVRIFRRTVSLGGWKADNWGGSDRNTACTVVEAGGIGEVCTKEEYRRRGISKLLLNDAMTIMREQRMQLSLLHAAPAFFPVYSKAGYTSVCSKWSDVRVQRRHLPDAPSSLFIREGVFPRDTSRLRSIHQKYSERRFSGCVARSEQYWNDYISAELKGSLFVLVRTGGEFERSNSAAGVDNDLEGTICGWLSLRCRSGKYQVREFGAAADAMPIAETFSLLLKHCLQAMPGSSSTDDTNDPIVVHLPEFVLNEIKESAGENDYEVFDFRRASSNDENGWMWKTIEGNGSGETISMSSVSEIVPHLIWPSDSF